MKEGALIRFLLVALPTGLLVMGVAAMMKTHMKGEAEPLDTNTMLRLEGAAMQRRPVSREDLEKTVTTLATRIGERHGGKPDALESAALWIESSLSGGNMGYLVERHSFDAGESEVRNLIVELPGRERRKEIIVVGAHYDTVPGSPGANDNATGVATLLALARAFTGEQQARTVRFVAFVNEEPPHFQTETMGSRVYARRCRSRGEEIVAMLCLESMGSYSEQAGSQKTPPGLEGGFPETGNFLAFVGDENSRYFVDSAISTFQRTAGMPTEGGVFPPTVPGATWSDHASFWEMGYPAVMVTDTAVYRDPNYHQPTDTAEKVDLEKLLQAARGLEAVVRVWANP